jgi:hypothetical protein
MVSTPIELFNMFSVDTYIKDPMYALTKQFTQKGAVHTQRNSTACLCNTITPHSKSYEKILERTHTVCACRLYT